MTKKLILMEKIEDTITLLNKYVEDSDLNQTRKSKASKEVYTERRNDLMFILAQEQTGEGAYAVEDEIGDKALYIFEEEDDAERFVGLLEADDYAV